MAASLRWLGVHTTSLSWQGDWQAVVAGEKGQHQQHPRDDGVCAASLSLQGERQTVVAGCVVCPLVVEAICDGVP